MKSARKSSGKRPCRGVFWALLSEDTEDHQDAEDLGRRWFAGGGPSPQPRAPRTGRGALTARSPGAFPESRVKEYRDGPILNW